MSELHIKLIRSTIGIKPKHRLTIEALGLRKVNSVVIQKDTPSIRGMIHQVRHLLCVKEV